MTYQRLLLRLASLPLLRETGNKYLAKRVWTIEEGAGARLRLRFPQNREFITGVSELPVQKEIESRLRPGGVFYDIGANIGFFSMIAGRLVGSTGSVCAFEPHPGNVNAVRENARLNGLSNVKVFPVAAGRESRTEELLMTGWDGGAALSTSSVTPASHTERTPVRVVRLDDFVKDGELPQPSFVKIDVEGAESEVLQGMKETIERARPVILFEVDDGDKERFSRRWEELDAWIRALGYEVRHLPDSYPSMKWNVGHTLALPLDAGLRVN